MSKEDIIRIIKSVLPILIDKFNVNTIALFGSFAKGAQTDTSDIDLVVEFKKPIGLKFIELGEYLEEILCRKVDLLTKDCIKSIRIKEIANSIERSLLYV